MSIDFLSRKQQEFSGSSNPIRELPQWLPCIFSSKHLVFGKQDVKKQLNSGEFFQDDKNGWAIIPHPFELDSWTQKMAELPTPTQDERSMGLLVHILGIFSGFLGPLIIYIIKRDSKFVSFHALQSLFWHLLYWAMLIVIMLVLVVLFFVLIFVQIVQVAHQPGVPASAPLFMLMFPLFWLVIVVMGLLNLVLGIIFAIKANVGDWVAYPLAGSWARRAAGLEG